MGDKEVNSLHEAEYHKKLMEELNGVCIEHLGVPKDIEVISRNRVYRIIFEDRVVKARIFQGPFEPYQFAREQNIDIFPKLILEVDRKNSTYWYFNEWIDGYTPFNFECKSIEKIKTIAPKYFYQQGQILGYLANFEKCGQFLSVHDVIWSNFIIDNNDRVWLIDLSKLRFEYVPEKWILFCIFFNPYLIREQKEAFCDGYIDKLKSRSELGREIISVSRKFIRSIDEKLAE